MGFANGLYIVDTHVVGQSHEPQDSLEVLLYHMERYGVNMGVLKNTVGNFNHLNAEIVQKYPDKFIAVCNDEQTQIKSQTGEKAWNIEDAVKEIDSFLATGLYRGIGDGLARDRTPRKKLIPWDERLDQICQLFELGRKYKVPMIYHVGTPIAHQGIDIARARAHYETCDNGNPLLCHEVASLFPDVPIIMAHAGVEASGYYMVDYEKCLNVAASHKNVFLETGMWWAELYEKPLKDPNIGAKKMVWGCGWAQRNNGQHWQPGETPETYCVNDLYGGPRKYLPDVWGWSLSQLGRLNIPQDDMNLILGGNAAFLYKIKTPVPHKRLFKPVDRGFAWETV